MSERSQTVYMNGNPLTLRGNKVEIGDKAPDFTVLANDLSPKKLSAFSGKKVVLTSVPSLDTGVCSTMTNRFNAEASKLDDDTVVLTISNDLPFAQARWCGAEGVEDVHVFSDYKDVDFGKKYGMLIDELRLLGRAIFVIDKDGVLRYKQVVEEITDEPDYDEALKAVKKL
ncbi:MAG: thiol peroxidase [Planctomycetota bacterium]|nr:thiol peroxidase [Planctomycetota bacterium]